MSAAAAPTASSRPSCAMPSRQLVEPSGFVFLRAGKRRAVWYAKYRLPDGRQVEKRVGPAWAGRGRPAPGTFSERMAEAWLAQVLDEARAGTLPGMVRTGATFEDACSEYLRWLEWAFASVPI